MNNIDYKFYGLDDTQAAAVRALSPQQLEYAYRMKAREYHIEDAATHAAELLEDQPEKRDALTDADYDNMARLFENRHDCNVPDTDQWHFIIRAYIDGDLTSLMGAD